MKNMVKGLGLFGGLFHTTSITKIFHIFFFIICVIILQLSAYYPRKLISTNKLSNLVTSKISSYRSFLINKMSEQFKILEYSLIILFIISGAIFLMSTSDLVSMFLSIELQSYGLYILSTIYKNSEASTKGGLTYFLLGGLSSCFILLGSALLYSNTATTNLDGIYVITSLSSFDELNAYNSNYINIALIIMTVGFLFKISAAPFHFWSPDVYDSIPTVVTTFVAIVSKISIFIFLLELLHYTGNNFYSFEYSWINSLLVSSLLSLIIGTVLGLTQSRIKKLFAYSTISHLGFILLALSIDSVESIQAFLFYLTQYSFSNLNAFIILLSIGYSYYSRFLTNKQFVSYPAELRKQEQLDQNNSPIQLTKQLKGLFYINPVLALSFTITIFSFVGIPPLIGFFGKQMVLSAALDSGYYFLTIVAILTSVISAVYYLTIIKEMFFYKNELDTFLNKTEFLQSNLKKENKAEKLLDKNNSELGKFDNNSNYPNNILLMQRELADKQYKVVLSSYLTGTISVLTLGIILFIFFPKEWLSMANILALNLNNT